MEIKTALMVFLGGGFGAMGRVWLDLRLKTAWPDLLGVGVLTVNMLGCLAIGYAFTEDLSIEAMVRAAKTAAEIASSKPSRTPVDLQTLDLPSYYPVQQPWGGVGMEKRVPMVRAWEAAGVASRAPVLDLQTSGSHWQPADDG